jgi:lipoate-protein ligase A
MALELYRLGRVSWSESQLAYHALARLGREGLILLSPREPYVSLGFHQDHRQELDLGYCRRQGLPMFRREVGGGAVYLDQDQIFWQLVLRRDNPLVLLDRARFYKTFLKPVVRTYRRMGVDARHKPVNDIVAGQRKITGAGAGEIGSCVVFVGNLMRDFNFAAMARVLNLPSRSFRERFRQSLENNLTTLVRELGGPAAAQWDDERIYDLLAAEFRKVLGPLPGAAGVGQLKRAMDELAPRMLSQAWLEFKRKPRPEREVKVRSGLFLRHLRRRTNRGWLELSYALREGRLEQMCLEGDFPDQDQALAQRLHGLLQNMDHQNLPLALERLCAGQG